MIHASYAIVPDFFNGLLAELRLGTMTKFHYWFPSTAPPRMGGRRR
jgi:hypothetical protein